MSAKITNIAKNTSYFTFALILQKIISFTYFTVIARALGPEDLGKYYFAISFTTIFAIFIDLGMSNVLTREVAKEENKASDFLSSILSLKIPLSILSFLIVLVAINLMGYPALTKDLVYISTISMILDSFTLVFFATIRGFHNLAYESVASVIFQLIVLSSGFAVLKLGWGLKWLIGALAAASAFNFIYSMLLVKIRFKVRIIPRINKEFIWHVAKITVPFGFFAIFNRIYTYFDSVLLSALAGDKYVGLYQVAFKIIFAIQFLPAAFTATLYPAMSTYWADNREQLVVTFERAMNYLIIISIPLTIGTIVLADKIVLIFKGGYAEAVLPLQITIASLLFLFINFPIGSLLNACDKQKENTINMGMVMLVSAAMNIILIPRFQAVGASITLLATNILMTALGLYYVPKIIQVRPWKIIRPFLMVIIGGALVGALAYYLKNYLNIFSVVAISGATYFVLLFVLGAFKKEDISSIWHSFAK